MADFLHMSIVPHEGVTAEQIEERLNKAIDWMRYRRGLYLLYTRYTPQQWNDSLEDLVKPDGILLVVAVDISKRQGWMTKSFWEWLEKERQP
jgi:hypothetical protein